MSSTPLFPTRPTFFMPSLPPQCASPLSDSSRMGKYKRLADSGHTENKGILMVASQALASIWGEFGALVRSPKIMNR